MSLSYWLILVAVGAVAAVIILLALTFWTIKTRGRG